MDQWDILETSFNRRLDIQHKYFKEMLRIEAQYSRNERLILWAALVFTWVCLAFAAFS